MRDRFKSLIVAVIAIAVAPFAVVAQVNLQPTASPTVTAEERVWFLDREPIVFAGTLYHPGGPQVYFNRFEMIRSGYYDGVPLYTRTTLEPYSMVFVPVAGGLMQPYERRRAGELAGTAGSTAPSFPIERPAGIAESTPDSSVVPQAPGPPTGIGPSNRAPSTLSPSTLSPSTLSMSASVPQPSATLGVVQTAPSTESSVATSGTAMVGPRDAQRSAARPEGLNGIFVEYAGKRWFNKGSAIPLNPSELVASGTYRGLPVYVKPGDPTTIYIPVAEPARTLVTPYSIAAPRRR